MTILRRILGVFVMIAGILGLLISLSGIAGVWMAKPVITDSLESMIDTLITSIDTSLQVMTVTRDALGATVNSVDALSEILSTTAVTVQDTQPVITQVTSLMGEVLPGALQAASDSLLAAQGAAQSLESAITSFETFRSILGAAPLIGSLIPSSDATYNPEKPLAESLGDLSTSLQDMPAKFEDMSVSLAKSDDNLVLIQSNLEVMAENVALISSSLNQYEEMVGNSQSSMENLEGMLTNMQTNLATIINVTAIVLTLFFLWLLAAQVVIFSQGWELFQGTADRMDAGTPEPEPAPAEAAPAN